MSRKATIEHLGHDERPNKASILQQINDAASNFGANSKPSPQAIPSSYAGKQNKLSELNNLRAADAKRAA